MEFLSAAPWKHFHSLEQISPIEYLPWQSSQSRLIRIASSLAENVSLTMQTTHVIPQEPNSIKTSESVPIIRDLLVELFRLDPALIQVWSGWNQSKSIARSVHRSQLVDHHEPVAEQNPQDQCLTAEGRRQLRAGVAICSRLDVPQTKWQSQWDAPPTSTEIALLLPVLHSLSALFPHQFPLRPLAQMWVVTILMLIIAIAMAWIVLL